MICRIGKQFELAKVDSPNLNVPMLLRLQNTYNAMSNVVHEQERIANNLANVNTAGFKRQRAFTSVLKEWMDVEDVPHSAIRSNQWSDTLQGAFDQTNNPLDVAIAGEGFFVLEDDRGTQIFTREGKFMQDSEGTLRTSNGNAVQGTAGDMLIPQGAKEIEINNLGAIRVDGREIGQLQVVTFEHPENLVRLDAATFESAGEAPVVMDQPDLMQGALEASNVNPLTAMTDMITNLRRFESNQKWLTTTDQILSRITSELGRF